MRFAQGGVSHILVAGLLGLVAALSALQFGDWWPWLIAAPAFFLAGFFAWFFRDPERTVGTGLVSPADGKVTRFDTVDDPELGRCDRICIFMSPIDVHVNRFPASGKVLRVTHIPGRHVPAFDKDSDANERVETVLETPVGKVKVVQVAGTVARRIVPYIRKGQLAAKGGRMGLIRFGSRCDVLVPAGKAAWTVKVGTQVHGAQDKIADVVGL